MNNILKNGFAASLLAATVFTARAQGTYDSGSLLGGNIPDNGSPTLFGHSIAGSGITSISQVQVQLTLTGNPVGQGWAGDIFASLNYNYGSQTAVLLNQPGVSGGNPAGFGFDGWTVTFLDGAANGDIHLGQPTVPNTILTGIWEPDGRLNATDNARPGLLNVFNGLPADGSWTLTLSDLSPGGTMTLNSWSIQMVGVPEPSSTVLVLGGLIILATARRRWLASR
jgi:hypothetical protein